MQVDVRLGTDLKPSCAGPRRTGQAQEDLAASNNYFDLDFSQALHPKG